MGTSRLVNSETELAKVTLADFGVAACGRRKIPSPNRVKSVLGIGCGELGRL